LTVRGPAKVDVVLLAALAADDPFALFAVTVNVYAVSKLNPVTVIGELEPVVEIDSGVDVAVNDVAAAPKVAAVKATVAVDEVTPVAVPIVGASGLAAEVAPLPILNELAKLLPSESLLTAI